MVKISVGKDGKMKDKNTNKPLFFILIFFAAIFVGGILWWIGVFLKNFVPVTKTKFLSYKTFVMQAEGFRYEPKLPKSAHDMRYYYYEGYFSDKNGYHATFSRDDYETMKAERLSAYGSYGEPLNERLYCYDGMKKAYLNRAQMKDRNVDYLDILLPVDEDDGHFYYLLSMVMADTGDEYRYAAILDRKSVV